MAKYQRAESILKELGEQAMEAAKDALADGAEVVADEVRRRCPVYDGRDHRVVKGALKKSIHVVKRKGGKEYHRIVADAQAQDGLFYGTIVEFSPKGRPFLYPALDAKRKTVQDIIVERVREAIRKK
ncbi:MAG: HK97-gp10 family putative phage morphogenesis protein [Selenomonadaceae bacterium]|nr:HK97-gp10 family putative phage morphogenesis protein [Selenomonadaceae bacterium]